MAEEDLGGVVIEISADVKPLLDGTEKAVAALQSIEKSTGSTATGMNQLNATATAVGAALVGMTDQGKQANALLEQIAASLKRTSEPQGDGISQATRQLAAMAQQVKIAQIAMDFGGRAAAQYAARIKMAGDASDAEKQQMIALAGRMYDLRASSAQAGKGFKGMIGMLQQAGYQIGDFAVQVQAGQSALVAFSQQGSQLLGAFGPYGAIAGALLTLGTIIGAQLFDSAQTGKSGLDLLKSASQDLDRIIRIGKDGIAAYSDEFYQLSQRNKQLAEDMKNVAIAEYIEAQVKAHKDLKAAMDDSVGGLSQVKGFFSSTVVSIDQANAALVRSKITAINWNEAYAQLIAQASVFNNDWSTVGQTVDAVAKRYGISAQKAFELVKAEALANAQPTNEHYQGVLAILEPYIRNTDDAGKATFAFYKTITDNMYALDQGKAKIDALSGSVKSYGSSIDDLMKRSRREAELTKRTGVERAKLQAQYDAEDNGATKEQTAELEANYVAAYKNTAAHNASVKAQNKSASEAQHATDALAKLKAQTDLSTESVRQRKLEEAKLQAVQSLGAGATAKQKKDAEIYAQQIFEKQEAVDKLAKSQQAQKAAEQEIASAKVAVNPTTGTAQDPLAEITLQEQQKEALYKKFRDEGLINEQTYQDALNAIRQEAGFKGVQITQDNEAKATEKQKAMLDNMASGFGDLTDVIGEGVGKQTAAYKAMFVVSKSFALASAMLSAQVAIGKAMEAGFPLDMALVAKAVAASGEVISTIGSIAFSGGKKYGGAVNAKSMYRVGENGPEIYQANNGNQYMVPGQRGQILPNGGAQGIQQNISFTINTTGGIDNATMNQMAQMMKQVSLATIKDQQRPNGLLQRSR